jgi:P4 family phage/plasmid primase-like protien
LGGARVVEMTNESEPPLTATEPEETKSEQQERKKLEEAIKILVGVNSETTDRLEPEIREDERRACEEEQERRDDAEGRGEEYHPGDSDSNGGNGKDGDNNDGSGKKKKEERNEEDCIIEEVCEFIMSKYDIVTVRESDDILYYKSGVYHPLGEILIAEVAEKEIGYDLTLRDLSEIKGHIMRRTYRNRDEFDTDICIINVANGLYDIATGEFKDHDPNYLSLRQSPILYDGQAGRNPKTFLKFLREVVYTSDIWTVIELMAYTFLRDNPFELITILLGSGSNGKSVLFGVLTALHGADNVSNVSLKTIIERPFGLYDLVGKACNLDAELSSGIIEDTAILKKITGRQRIRVEQKNQKAFDAAIYAKEWLNCNSLPQISANDQNDAYYRRNVVVGFPNRFEDVENPSEGIRKLDPDLISKLTTSEELSALFNLLMFALRGILKKRKISINEKTIQERREKYEIAANPIEVFMKVAVEEDSKEGDLTRKDTAFLAYHRFCDNYKISKMSNTMFGKHMKKHFEEGRTTIEGKTVRFWKGVRLTEEYLRRLLPEQVTLENATEGGIWGV